VRKAVVAAAAALAAVAGLSVERAEAAPGMLVGMYDDGQTLFNGKTAFPTLKHLRVQIVRIQLRWGGPSGVALRRPRDAPEPDDPAYDWTLYDRAVLRAKRARMKVLFSIWGTPRWENRGAGYNRVPRRLVDLEEFAYAAATRYSGRFRRADGVVLPAVKHWLAWNEPNNPVFLRPQFRWTGKRFVRQGAIDYARICNAVYSGIHGTALRGEKVACGATGPRGNNDPTSSRPSISPLAFVRAVDEAGLHNFDAWAHHPYYGSKIESPRSPPPTRGRRPPSAVTLGNLQALVDEVTRRYGRKRIWITEYGYQTNPPDRFFGVSWARQAAYLAQAYTIARRHPRVDMMLWYLLQDEPSVGGWQSGLQTTTGRRKPAFSTYRRLPRR
jgi:hypothetical protein